MLGVWGGGCDAVRFPFPSLPLSDSYRPRHGAPAGMRASVRVSSSSCSGLPSGSVTGGVVVCLCAFCRL